LHRVNSFLQKTYRDPGDLIALTAPTPPSTSKRSFSQFLRRGIALYQRLTPGILRRKVG